MTPSPPKKLTIPDVPRYIRTHYGQDVGRMTVYNWIKVGRKGKKLKTMPGNVVNHSGGPHAKQVTTTQWVDEFLQEATKII